LRLVRQAALAALAALALVVAAAPAGAADKPDPGGLIAKPHALSFGPFKRIDRDFGFIKIENPQGPTAHLRFHIHPEELGDEFILGRAEFPSQSTCDTLEKGKSCQELILFDGKKVGRATATLEVFDGKRLAFKIPLSATIL
jgi:hypothetical protein